MASSFAEEPATSAIHARLFWSSDIDPHVLSASVQCSRCGDVATLDFRSLPCAASILILPDGRQEILVGTGQHPVRISVREGSVLDGPVGLHFHVSGPDGLNAKILSLRRIFWLQRHGTWPQPPLPRPSILTRRFLILRTLDALAADKSHRAIASALFGNDRVASDWENGSHYLRSSVRRLIAAAKALVDGGYKRMLASS